MSEPIERVIEHRPFPMPDGPWVMFQSWRDLLFLHWPIAQGDLRPLVPPELELEQYEGSAWVGLTPFRIAELHPRFIPPIPSLSEFPEMNLRTYVRARGKPGVFFFSLDAGSSLAVIGARLGYRLPYFRATMKLEKRGDWFHYRSRRSGGTDAEFDGRYRPAGPVFEAEPGTLEYFLTERYALFTVLAGGRILTGDIHHRPWPLQLAEAEIGCNTVPGAHGITLPETAPLLHFAGKQDTIIWAPSVNGT